MTGLDAIADLARALLERDLAAARHLEAKADAIERRIAPDQLQAHSRQLPTETEVDQGGFAARQLRLAAEELRNGFHIEEGGSDVCQRKSCGWYRDQHRDTGEGPRCPYHYKRQRDGSWPTFMEKDDDNA